MVGSFSIQGFRLEAHPLYEKVSSIAMDVPQIHFVEIPLSFSLKTFVESLIYFCCEDFQIAGTKFFQQIVRFKFHGLIFKGFKIIF